MGSTVCSGIGDLGNLDHGRSRICEMGVKKILSQFHFVICIKIMMN